MFIEIFETNFKNYVRDLDANTGKFRQKTQIFGNTSATKTIILSEMITDMNMRMIIFNLVVNMRKKMKIIQPPK